MNEISIEIVDAPAKAINEQLLALTRACPMDGNISIVIEREPDFFALLAAKGDYRVLLARVNGEVIGTFALVIKEAYINQKSHRTGYLCDLKIHPDYRDKSVAFRLMKLMAAQLKELSLDFTFCVIASGNTKVEKLLMGRLGIPGGTRVADFRVFQLLPKKRSPAKVAIQEYSQNHSHTTLDLLNHYYQKYQFSTILSEEKSIIGDKAWVICENEQPVAFLSIVDMKSQKQNKAIKIPAYLKAVLALANVFWPRIKTPKEGDAISILNIQYLAHAPGHEKQAMALVKQARHYAYQKGYTFLSYGMDARNTLIKAFSKQPGVTFDSVGYVIVVEGQTWDQKTLCHDNFHLV